MIKYCYFLILFLLPLLILAQSQQGKVNVYENLQSSRILATGDNFTNDNTWMAHETLPLNSTVRLSNPKNGKSIGLKVKDRGPFLVGYVAQVPGAVAEQLNLVSGELVKLELVQLADYQNEIDYEKLLSSLDNNAPSIEKEYINVMNENSETTNSFTWQLASFSNKENASKYIKAHQKDFKAKLYILLFNNSLFKVCAGKYKNREEAEEAKSNFNAEYQSAFILNLP